MSDTPKRIYIHIGIHKTATSSIQESLRLNKKSIEKCGIHTLECFGLNSGMCTQSIFSSRPEGLYINIVEQRSKEETLENNRKLTEELKKELRETRTPNILISGEDLCLLTAEECQRMKSFFTNYFAEYEVKIIVCTRDLLKLTRSLAQQYIKAGGDHTYVLREMRDPQRYKYKRMLSNYAAAFGKENVIAYKFEESILSPQGPVEFFLYKLGLTEDQIRNFKYKNTNKSVSLNAIKLNLYINSKSKLIEKGVKSSCRSEEDTRPLDLIKGESYSLGYETEREILETQMDDLIWLKENFDIDYTDARPLQSEDKDSVTFTQDYHDQVLEALESCSGFVTDCVYGFLKESLGEPVTNDEKEILTRLIGEIENRYPDVSVP